MLGPQALHRTALQTLRYTRRGMTTSGTIQHISRKTHPDEGAAVERDHRRAPVGGSATSQVFLALGADDHNVQPEDVKRVHLRKRFRYKRTATGSAIGTSGE